MRTAYIKANFLRYWMIQKPLREFSDLKIGTIKFDQCRHVGPRIRRSKIPKQLMHFHKVQVTN